MALLPPARVKVHSNWSYIDTLNDIPLQQSERLFLHFPDGEILAVDIDVEESSEIGGGGLSPDYIPVRKAYATVRAHGVDSRIRLANSQVKAQRPELPNPDWKDANGKTYPTRIRKPRKSKVFKNLSAYQKYTLMIERKR